MGIVPRWPCQKLNKVYILATYANSYVGDLDVALSAHSEHPSARSERLAGKRVEPANDRGLRKLFSFGSRQQAATAA